MYNLMMAIIEAKICSCC